jgi:hypothetical protein
LDLFQSLEKPEVLLKNLAGRFFQKPAWPFCSFNKRFLKNGKIHPQLIFKITNLTLKYSKTKPEFGKPSGF